MIRCVPYRVNQKIVGKPDRDFDSSSVFVAKGTGRTTRADARCLGVPGSADSRHDIVPGPG